MSFGYLIQLNWMRPNFTAIHLITRRQPRPSIGEHLPPLEVVAGKKVVADSISSIRSVPYDRPTLHQKVNANLQYEPRAIAGVLISSRSIKSSESELDMQYDNIMNKEEIEKTRKMLTHMEKKRQEALLLQRRPSWAQGARAIPKMRSGFQPQKIVSNQHYSRFSSVV